MSKSIMRTIRGPSVAGPAVDPAVNPAGRRPRAPVAAGIAGPVLLLAVLAGAGQVLPVTTLLTLESAVAFALLAVATNLLLGYGGMVSFGQAAFFGAGSYTVALGWLHWKLSFWIGLALSPVVGGILALLVGLIALRSRRLYFALLTLAFSQLFYVLAEERYSFTLGANGIVGPMLPDWLIDPLHGYLFVLGVAAVCILMLWKVTASPFGLVLRAARENRERMEALGVNVFAHQLTAFVVSGAFCSVAGVLYLVYSQIAYPDLLDWTQSGYAVFAVVIGGMYAFFGPVLGAGVYTFGSLYLTQHTQDWQLVLGLALLVIVLFRPDGLASLWAPGQWRRWIAARRGQTRRGAAEQPETAARDVSG